MIIHLIHFYLFQLGEIWLRQRQSKQQSTTGQEETARTWKMQMLQSALEVGP